MEFADKAELAKLFGESDKFLSLTEQAFLKEKAAADLMVDKLEIEPTRSVLHRSAATLAWRCGKFEEAKKLAYRALAGNPPAEIEVELYELLDAVKLAEAAFKLGRCELEVTLNGGAIGHGFAAADAIAPVIPSLQKLLNIMFRRRYRSQVSKPNSVKSVYGKPLYIEFRPGSLVISARFGEPSERLLPGFEDFDEIISPLLQNLEMLEQGQDEALQERLSDPLDFRDFVTAARSLAPDGKEISKVHWQASTVGELKTVRFTRLRNDLPKPEATIVEQDYRESETTITARGVLRVADAHGKHECKLIDDNDGVWTVDTSAELITEIVRTHFNQRVEIRGLQMQMKNLVKRISVKSADQIRAI